MHVYQDPRKAFFVRHPGGGKFAESTRIAPAKVIKRRPDGTLGALSEDKLLTFGGTSPRQFRIFEYLDPDRHLLSKVTLLEVEPACETLLSLAKGVCEQQVEIEVLSPAQMDVFTVRCKHQASEDILVEVGSIVPSSRNEPGEPITIWTVPLKVAH